MVVVNEQPGFPSLALLNLAGPRVPSELDDAEPGYIHSVAPDPRRLDPLDNPRITKEKGCIRITDQKKYYKFEGKEGPVFIKRNLTPSEYLVNLAGNLRIPTYVPDDKKAPVIKVLEGYVAQLHTIKLDTMGGLSGGVIVPYRVALHTPQHQLLKPRKAPTAEFVPCHNDLGEQNIIADGTTLKIICILYAGLYPPFERAFYLRVSLHPENYWKLTTAYDRTRPGSLDNLTTTSNIPLGLRSRMENPTQSHPCLVLEKQMRSGTCTTYKELPSSEFGEITMISGIDSRLQGRAASSDSRPTTPAIVNLLSF
ncbi:hypothetical protein M413DRAFT_29569 [Hebeloma cylindrosporum]|uniref:Aminoglycoside phosphotransferase domain-containing protein n=1 Tax=Hebeloma cylindrosporum TaxID=76867 RepID=A0A0C2XMR4_HEBCY|nr:hypothetical protein M413DRAFT_29569 [Hebeloma cylindrosporum h7]